MGIKEDVKNDFQEYIALNGHKWPAELIRSLKHNERMPLFLNNLTRECKALDNETVVAKRQRLFTRKNIKLMVYSLTELFLTNVMRVANEQHKSDLEKSRIIAEQQAVLDIDRMADEILKDSVDRSESL